MKYIIFILFGMFLSGCVTIPKEYVGEWGNAYTWLSIKQSGGLNYIRRKPSALGGQKTSRSEWGIREITNQKISGVLPFVSIAIEGPPKKDENGLIFLSVEGSKLYRSVDSSGDYEESDDILNRIIDHEFCKVFTGSLKHSDCD